ncbi:hypothetical protein LCGC14_2253390, partial [marine sediment metagenome]
LVLAPNIMNDKIEELFKDLDKLIENMENGVPLERSEELDKLAKLAVEAKENDTRTEEEIIDGVEFIMNTKFGGP